MPPCRCFVLCNMHNIRTWRLKLCVAQAGHLRSSRAPAGEGAPAQTGPASPLSGYAEQMQRDLAASFGNVSVQQSVPEPNSGRPAPAQQETSSFSQSAAAVMSQSIPVPHAASAATLSQAASRPAASISSAPGASFANPLMSMHARYVLMSTLPLSFLPTHV